MGFEPTTFRVRAEYSDPVELHIHKKLYLILSTNYNHLTTLYPPVNNLLKKWPGRLVTLQHLVLFRDTLIYFSYYRIINSSVWLELNQRPMLIHAFTVSFTIIVSTDLPLNYTQIKMVGYVGNAPTQPEGNGFTDRSASLSV